MPIDQWGEIGLVDEMIDGRAEPLGHCLVVSQAIFGDQFAFLVDSELAGDTCWCDAAMVNFLGTLNREWKGVAAVRVFLYGCLVGSLIFHSRAVIAISQHGFIFLFSGCFVFIMKQGEACALEESCPERSPERVAAQDWF